MDKSILNDVIGAEKEIQACIEKEQVALKEMLERTRRETAELIAQEERASGAVRERDLDEARRQAEERAREIVEDASTKAARLDRLDDRTLTGVVMKRIPRILLE